MDFLLERAGSHLALEVKSAQRVDPSHLSGLRAVGDLPSIERRVLVYAGQLERRTEDGIEIWPVSRLIERLATGNLWP